MVTTIVHSSTSRPKTGIPPLASTDHAISNYSFAGRSLGLCYKLFIFVRLSLSTLTPLCLRDFSRRFPQQISSFLPPFVYCPRRRHGRPNNKRIFSSQRNFFDTAKPPRSVTRKPPRPPSTPTINLHTKNYNFIISMKASGGTLTLLISRFLFFPNFCRSRSFCFRCGSPECP